MLSDDPNDFCWFDTETRSHPETAPPYDNVKDCGAYAYAQNARPIMLTYCIGERPVRNISHDDWNARGGDPFLYLGDLPDDFIHFRQRALEGKAWFVAWNTAFDRLQMNAMAGDDTWMRPDMTLDAMAQAVASNLPASLGGASKMLNRGGKVDQGKALIRLFTPPDGETPHTRPAEWQEFKHYGDVDTEELRAIWLSTMPLTRAEWEVYWANEEINDRGMGVDVEFVAAAARVADAAREHTNRQLSDITDGAITAVTQIQRLTEWVHDNTNLSEVRDAMVKAITEDDETGLEVTKLGLDRNRVERVMAILEREDEDRGLTDIDWAILQAVELRRFGGSNTPGKFGKILDMQTDGRLRGQYVFNGANQTGRFSSRGVQIHNLIRSTLGPDREPEAIEMITGGDDK